MGLQRYRADQSDAPDANGAVAHYARWMGGPSLSKITNCPVRRAVMPPRTVFITGAPDTFFTQPAACHSRGRIVRGYVTHTDGAWVFHPDRDAFRSLNLKVSITYDTVSESSVVDGATADNGFIAPDGERRSFSNGRKRDIERNVSAARRGKLEWSLRDALEWLKRQDGGRDPWEATQDGDSIAVRVFGEHDPSNADELQATYTLHIKGQVSLGTWERLARALESHGARFV